MSIVNKNKTDRWINQLLSLGVKGRVPFLSCPKTFFILIGERLSRGKVLHIGPAAFFISLALSPSSAFRLGSALGVRLDRLGFFPSIEGSQRVSHSSPIRLVNPLL
ncbi:hypothetical protein H5410_022347 [Solanum commersonii]|uniref:Uncharacterized protein n=1 Tax=Solanum commersonii TaxID=4109 RepID=A0A9J5ZEI8_SOLCO|nr:hypothetical protein H5410_022347 [Solanum commersonii]